MPVLTLGCGRGLDIVPRNGCKATYFYSKKARCWIGGTTAVIEAAHMRLELSSPLKTLSLTARTFLEGTLLLLQLLNGLTEIPPQARRTRDRFLSAVCLLRPGGLPHPASTWKVAASFHQTFPFQPILTRRPTRAKQELLGSKSYQNGRTRDDRTKHQQKQRHEQRTSGENNPPPRLLVFSRAPSTRRTAVFLVDQGSFSVVGLKTNQPEGCHQHDVFSAACF